MAVLSMIFQSYSLEFAVYEWATDDEVANMGTEERNKLYRLLRTRRERQSEAQLLRSRWACTKGLDSYPFDWSRRERRAFSAL